MQLQNSSYKLEEMNQNSEADSLQLIQNWMATQLAKQLSLNPKNVDVREPLTRYGLDSIDAVTLVGELEDWLDLELPSTLLWDYPTIEKSAQYLVSEFDISGALANVNLKATEDVQETVKAEPAPKALGGLWKRLSGA